MLCFGSVHHAQTCWFGGMHVFGMFWCMQKSMFKICGKISWCGELCIDQMCRAIVRDVPKCVKKQRYLSTISFVGFEFWSACIEIGHGNLLGFSCSSSSVEIICCKVQNLRNDCLCCFCSHLLFSLPLNYWSSTVCPVQVISDVCVVALGCFLGTFGMIGWFTVCSVQKISMYWGRILKGWIFLLPKCFSNPTCVRSQVHVVLIVGSSLFDHIKNSL